jgi:hypothetical protein
MNTANQWQARQACEKKQTSAARKTKLQEKKAISGGEDKPAKKKSPAEKTIL